MFRCRLKYLIFAPILCSFLALLGLALWNLSAGCSFEKGSTEELTKSTEIIKERLTNLKAREERQNRLQDELDSLQKIVRQQIKLSKNMPISNLATIYGITPTYTRLTQKAELTRLCQTLLHVANFHWIVVEDSNTKTDIVARLLQKCGIPHTHLSIRTSIELQTNVNNPRWLKARGAEQRNAGLHWLRTNLKTTENTGVVYFMDDDNTYDLELFKQIRQTQMVSVWPVGLVGGLVWEGPICKDGKVIKFRAAWDLSRIFPIDMAGFAINLTLILNNPSVVIDPGAQRGHLESSLLKQLVTRDQLEPLANNCSKILVWHTQTLKPKLKHDEYMNKKEKYQFVLEV